MKPPETMTVNLETERMKYGLLMAADIVAGKVVELDVYIRAKIKTGSLSPEQRDGQKPIHDICVEELLARRSLPPPGAKVPDDIDEKFKEYSILYPADPSLGEGPARNQFFK